ncbi:MAG: amidohydrolase, partial [Saprospiraceae bacterium]|nr:amidohydrolase [Saprospiraceae bacterium]
MKRLFLIYSLLWITSFGFSQSSLVENPKEFINDHIEKQSSAYRELALKIWDLAELGFLETESTALLMQPLQEAGFSIETGVAGMPTSFIAEWGNGGPVIAFLAEFDALPAMSQAAVPYNQAREEGQSGHACGHHLFG